MYGGRCWERSCCGALGWLGHKIWIIRLWLVVPVRHTVWLVWVISVLILLLLAVTAIFMSIDAGISRFLTLTGV